MSLVEGGAVHTPRKAALLQVAAALFAARGYHAVSTDEIGQAAGISGPGVYRHFGSKAELLLTLCESAMDHLLAGAHEIVAAAGPAGSPLGELVAFHVEFAVRERAVLAVYLREQRELPARELRALRRRQREYEGIWGAAVASAGDLDDAEVRASVKLVLSMLNGSAHIRDNLARPRLRELLHRLAAGALNGVGIPLDLPGG